MVVSTKIEVEGDEEGASTDQAQGLEKGAFGLGMLGEAEGEGASPAPDAEGGGEGGRDDGSESMQGDSKAAAKGKAPKLVPALRVVFGDSEGSIRVIVLSDQFGSSNEPGHRRKNVSLFADALKDPATYFKMNVHSSEITAVKYLPFIERLATASRDGTLCIVDLDKKCTVKTYTGIVLVLVLNLVLTLAPAIRPYIYTLTNSTINANTNTNTNSQKKTHTKLQAMLVRAQTACLCLPPLSPQYFPRRL